MQIVVLGPLEVRADSGLRVEVSGTRLRTLLIRLALEPGRVVTADRLMDALWVDRRPAGAANALQALVSRLRRTVVGIPVRSQAAGYGLMVAPDAVDLWRFERLVAAGRAQLPADPAGAADTLREALDLWHGPPLADVADADFARAHLARLTALRLAAIGDRVEADLRLGAGPALVAELEELVTANPLREPLVGQLMRALYAANQPNDALAVYAQARGRLAEQLGVDPSPTLSALHLAMLRGEPQTAVGLPAVLPAHADPVTVPDRANILDLAGRAAGGPKGAPGGVVDRRHPSAVIAQVRRTNLRAGLTSFVGRDDDIGGVRALTGRSRLTTLTGPGGAGKTRLAVEVARSLLDGTPDGVWLVELAPVTEPADVARTALAALGLREQALLGSARLRVPAADSPADPLGRLVAALAGRSLLLVLDNCEHLVEAAAVLADRVLGECPHVRILATSREPLRITGECLWPVEPLALPPAGAPAADAAGYAAVRLLADRVGALRPGFAVDARNAPAVIRICQALDGIPLAIELAAARLRAMTPEAVAARLDDRFGLLTGGSRTALLRHRTLAAVVDWSWDLLDGAERALLSRLAVFVGGATADAVEAVCAGGPVAARDVPDLLAGLVDKSLVVASDEARPRYRLLETIRAYGLDKLAAAGEQEQERLRRAHAGYFLALAEAAEPHLRGREQLVWLAYLTDDHDNIHSALRGAIAAGDAGTALRLVGALGWYWSLRGHRAEAVTLTDGALAVASRREDGRGEDGRGGGAWREVRAVAYAIRAFNAFGGTSDIAAILALFRAAEDAVADLGGVHPMLRLVGPFRAFVEYLGEEKGLEGFANRLDDPDLWVGATARAIRGFGSVNLGRRHAEADADYRAALAAFRALGERWGTSTCLAGIAELALQRGDHVTAVACCEEALTLVGELGATDDLVQFHGMYAFALHLQGRTGEAEAVLADARRVAERAGGPESLAAVDYAYGELARVTGDPDGARAMLAQAAAHVRLPGVASQFRAMIASSLGYLDAAAGDLDAARARHTEAVEAALSSANRPVIAHVLVGVADLATRAGDASRAAALLGASLAIRGVPDRSLPDEARVAATARAVLGEPEFTEAYRQGSAATVATVHALCDLPR